MEIGVPVVFPSKTPERISTSSPSFLWVVKRLWPVFCGLELLDIGFVQWKTRRAAVDDNSDGLPVGFSPGRYFKYCADGRTCCHVMLISNLYNFTAVWLIDRNAAVAHDEKTFFIVDLKEGNTSLVVMDARCFPSGKIAMSFG